MHVQRSTQTIETLSWSVVKQSLGTFKIVNDEQLEEFLCYFGEVLRLMHPSLPFEGALVIVVDKYNVASAARFEIICAGTVATKRTAATLRRCNGGRRSRRHRLDQSVPGTTVRSTSVVEVCFENDGNAAVFFRTL